MNLAISQTANCWIFHDWQPGSIVSIFGAYTVFNTRSNFWYILVLLFPCVYVWNTDVLPYIDKPIILFIYLFSSTNLFLEPAKPGANTNTLCLKTNEITMVVCMSHNKDLYQAYHQLVMIIHVGLKNFSPPTWHPRLKDRS